MAFHKTAVVLVYYYNNKNNYYHNCVQSSFAKLRAIGSRRSILRHPTAAQRMTTRCQTLVTNDFSPVIARVNQCGFFNPQTLIRLTISHGARLVAESGFFNGNFLIFREKLKRRWSSAPRNVNNRVKTTTRRYANLDLPRGSASVCRGLQKRWNSVPSNIMNLPFTPPFFLTDFCRIKITTIRSGTFKR